MHRLTTAGPRSAPTATPAKVQPRGRAGRVDDAASLECRASNPATYMSSPGPKARRRGRVVARSVRDGRIRPRPVSPSRGRGGECRQVNRLSCLGPPMCGSRIWRGLEASQRLGGGTWGMVRKDMRSRSQPKSRVRYRNGGSGGRGAATELAAVGDKRPVVVRLRPRSGPLGPRSFDLSFPCTLLLSANLCKELGRAIALYTLLIALVASLRGNFSALPRSLLWHP